MNKLAFLILRKVVSSPGIGRRTLVADIQSEYKKSPHEIAIVIADLKSQELLQESDEGFKPFPEKDEFYQKMQPFSDDQVLDLMIRHLNKTGGPEVISHLNGGSQLYLNREDEDYFEALLTQNDFVRTTFPSGPTIPTFFISNSGRINLRKYGGYLEYLDAQKPTPTPEEVVLNYLAERAGLMYSPRDVFEECGIALGLMDRILAVLEDKIEKHYDTMGLGYCKPFCISITAQGLRYLHGVKTPATTTISHTHQDHSVHTHGNHSPVVAGNLTSGNANIVNTGDHVTQTVHIAIDGGDWDGLNKTLSDNGIDEEDIKELKSIVESEKAVDGKLGSKALAWVLNVSGKAVQGIGKIATGVGSNLIATWIKNYYGIHS